METLKAVLDELSQVDGTLNCVRHALNHDGVIFGLGGIEELPSTIEISANAHASSDSDLVGGKHFLWNFNSSVGLCH